MKPSHLRGFTLIEVMVVVAIIALLASLAYPAYRSSVLKGKRAQGRTALAELLQQQERYMTQRNCYLAFTTSASFIATATAATVCGTTAASTVPFKVFSGDNPSSAAYKLYADACPGGLSIQECVRINAEPINADLEAGTLRILSTGTKDCTGTVSVSNPALCWP
jgi:type IV pilus assembly protein PilE